MSRKQTRRKCRCCRKFFTPDYRNVGHQQFCGEEACRRASKAASQRRWLRKGTNRDYFRGADNTERVQQWRKTHPGYWKKGDGASKRPQAFGKQPVNPEQRSCNVRGTEIGTLQDLCLTEHPAFLGLISMVTGSTLQEDIELTTRQLLLRGKNILGLGLPEESQTQMMLSLYENPQTPDPSGSPPPDSTQLQLG